VRGGPESAGRRRAELAVAAAALALAAVAAALTLYGAWSAFTWGKFRLIDYGRYVNAIWNSGHGRPFTVLVDRTYLSTHMSFTLALLGPFFWIWDHPFLPAVLQWLFLAGGAAVLWRTAALHGLRRDTGAAVVFFFVANPFTQAVLLCEFHGVSLYLLLMPWLHACLRDARRTAWIPLVLLLGVREEAGLLAIPLVTWFAVRDRWRTGWVLAAVSVAWALVAIEVLFPLLGGIRFEEARAQHVFSPGHYLSLVSPREILQRAAPLLPCVLALAPFTLDGGWRALAWFPLAAVAIAATAAEPNMYLLRYHYPAAIIVLATLGLLEAMIVSSRASRQGRLDSPGHALALIGATLVWHLAAGFLPLGGRYDRIYGNVHPMGEELLDVVREIPKSGVLLCPSELAGFCANRADLVTWEWLDEKRHRPDLVFFRLKEAGRFRSRYRAMLESGEFGVRALDRGYALLERGHSVERNAEVIEPYLSEPASPPGP
jgi:hypothetical protein